MKKKNKKILLGIVLMKKKKKFLLGIGVVKTFLYRGSSDNTFDVLSISKLSPSVQIKKG